MDSYNTALQIHDGKPFDITYGDGSSVKGYIESANVTVSGSKNRFSLFFRLILSMKYNNEKFTI